MFLTRKAWPISTLLPEFRFVRTLQAPDHIVFDKRISRYRISSQAFRPSSEDGGLSGDLEQLLLYDGLSATAFYPSVKRSIGAASLTVGDVNSLDLSVHHEPVLNNWYHGAVRGIRSSHSKKLSRLAAELIAIDQSEAARREAEQTMAALAR